MQNIRPETEVISPQTSDDRSRGPYICVIHRKTMMHIVYIMILGQRAAHKLCHFLISCLLTLFNTPPCCDSTVTLTFAALVGQRGVYAKIYYPAVLLICPRIIVYIYIYIYFCEYDTQ